MAIDKNTPTIGGEKKIWDAACVPRGQMTAFDYQKVVSYQDSQKDMDFMYKHIHNLLTENFKLESLRDVYLKTI